MNPDQVAVAMLFAVEPTDRALAGWRHPVWLALGTNAVLRKEFSGMPLPCGWAMRWYGDSLPS
jgi:hypothetical protein